jgi:prepilin-type N-terminal cleavage/methylation domain-containing protein
MARRAFTLLEVLVSVALGSVICYTAYVCLRVCSHSVSVVNKLSLENNLMRTGVRSGLEEVDFWTTVDDPNDPTRQPLRQQLSDGSWPPFRRCDASFNFNATEMQLRFDPHLLHAIYRGHDNQKITPYNVNGYTDADWDQVWGDYSLFLRIDHPDLDHRWLAAMIKNISWNLGYYALLDYMPCNTIYSWYRADGTLDVELYPAYINTNRREHGKLYYGNSDNMASRDFGSLMFDSPVFVTNAKEYIDALYPRQLFRLWYQQVYRWTPDLFDFEGGAIERTAIRPAVLATKPAHWPDVTTTVNRFLNQARWINGVRVICANPLNGEQMKLYFSATGTTLRGARRQRGLDSFP